MSERERERDVALHTRGIFHRRIFQRRDSGCPSIVRVSVRPSGHNSPRSVRPAVRVSSY